ncbi:MAG TPA: GGDEF domain-containing protein [Terriglobales bacterium]|jgi:diguanylate cyclase (GGDEF)-like protein|nr:GGDEF domain-containing protein [Terriglobales bacterium]
MLTQSKSNLARVTQQLSKLEKRDWELWAIVSVTGILVSATLLAILFHAAFLTNGGIHFELTVSRPLAIGLFILLGLLNTYLVSKRFEVRRLREQLISTSLQNQLIEQQSFIDPLTEIYNRQSLDQIAGRFISQAMRRNMPMAFLMVDADKFKQINTRFGHLTGDFVLAEIAGLLKSSIRASDAIVRYGGDEFLIILADTTAVGAEKVIERIHRKFDEWNEAGHLEDFQVNVSIGAAEWHDGDTLDEILDQADKKMYAHKG